MLMGEFQHMIDQKGRLIVPAKLREELGISFVVTKGLDRCLFVFAMEEWTGLETKIRQLPLTNENARKFSRLMLAGAVLCEPDNNGRVMIPPPLRQYASLRKDIVSIGMSNRVEIWSKERWDEYNDESNFENSAFIESMSNLGI